MHTALSLILLVYQKQIKSEEPLTTYHRLEEVLDIKQKIFIRYRLDQSKNLRTNKPNLGIDLFFGDAPSTNRFEEI